MREARADPCPREFPADGRDDNGDVVLFDDDTAACVAVAVAASALLCCVLFEALSFSPRI